MIQTISYDANTNTLSWTASSEYVLFKVSLSTEDDPLHVIYEGSDKQMPLDIDPMPAPVDVVVVGKRENGEWGEPKPKRLK